MIRELNEIGGYFGLEQYYGKEYHSNAIGVNSGRNALLYILMARKVKKLYIPIFLCDTVYKVCEREGFAYEFYAVDSALRPIFNKMLGDDEWLYVVNYYGLLPHEYILELKKRYGRIILDNVQDFFRSALPDVDTVYSCRKFFGVPDGGYVVTDAVLNEQLSEDSSAERMVHILGRYEKGGAAFYNAFKENDEQFYKLPLRRMSALTRNLLRSLDYEQIAQRRQENYLILAKALDATNRLAPVISKGPFCYPYYCPNGDAVRKALVAQKIYIPTLWPNVLENGDALSQDFAVNILPLPCDQRYTEADMERILNVITNQEV